MQWFTSDFGLKKTRKVYGVGAVFDASGDAGKKAHTWRLGARRRIGIVKEVFNVPGHTIVVYRTAANYRVDSVILKAARALHVYSGHPNSFDLLDYRRRIAGRRKTTS
jgi:hypothetical protein